MQLAMRHPGRPQKFGRRSRPVTVTLPEDVIERLAAIDADLGRSIVTLIERRPRSRRETARRPAELSSYAGHAVIIVIPVKMLQRLPGVQLVPIGNNRALISLDRPHSIPSLELAIRDVLDRDDVASRERETLDAIAEILRSARLSRTVRLEERTIIVLESKRERRSK